MKRNLLVVLLCLISQLINAQFLDFGADPPSITWEQINTKHYKLIFPKNYKMEALRYAILLEAAYTPTQNTLSSDSIRRFPVIFHPYNMQMNGMVAWAPKRMELLPSPAPSFSFQTTDKQLSIHEQRHVFQLQKLSKSVNLLRFLFGEQIVSLPSVAIPRWCLEGDAVTTETALSSSGRGRDPNFLMHYRAQMATGKNLSLDTWALGSYKNYSHDFYALGYSMTAYLRTKYGSKVWDNIYSDMLTKSFIPPFASALKRNTGLTPKRLYDSTFKYMEKNFEGVKIVPTNYTDVSKLTTNYCSYTSPVSKGDSIIAIQSSLHDIDLLILRTPDGTEKTLCDAQYINSKLVIRGDKMYWTMYSPSPRFRHLSYSEVVCYDFQNSSIKYLTPHKRYLTPAINGDGSVLAVYNPETNGKNYIVLLNASTGQLIGRIPTFQNFEIKDMDFDKNGYLIVSVVGSQGNGLFILDTQNKEWYGLLRPQRCNIDKLRVEDHEILFESGYSGINNIYKMDLNTYKVTRLTNVEFGASGPSIYKDSLLLFSNYNALGYKLSTIPLNDISEDTTSFNKAFELKWAKSLSDQETFNIDTLSYDGVAPYESSHYSKTKNLIHIHSWAPFYFNMNEIFMQSVDEVTNIKPGVMLLSQNRLNTLMGQVAFYHDFETTQNHGVMAFKYTGILPVFQARIDIGGRNYQLNWDKVGDKSISYYTDGGKTGVEVEAGTYIPLDFSRRSSVQGIQPYLNFNYTNNKIETGLESNHFKDFKHIETGVYFYKYRQLALRDIFPRWGTEIWFRHGSDPTSNLIISKLYLGRMNVYFPGIFRNNGIRVRGTYQHQVVSGQFFFPEQLVNPIRGGRYHYSAVDLKMLQTDYAFNLACPDWSLGSILYMNRIRSYLFFDYSYENLYYQNPPILKNYSYGVELLFDTYWFRIASAPVNLGFRFVKTKFDNLQTEFSMGIRFQ